MRQSENFRLRLRLAEYGHVMPKNIAQFDKKVDECINSLEGDAVQLVIDTLRDTAKSIRGMTKSRSRHFSAKSAVLPIKPEMQSTF